MFMGIRYSMSTDFTAAVISRKEKPPYKMSISLSGKKGVLQTSTPFIQKYILNAVFLNKNRKMPICKHDNRSRFNSENEQ